MKSRFPIPLFNRVAILLLHALLFSSLSFSQRYYRDVSFNGNGYTTNTDSRVIEVLPDKKGILVAGAFDHYDKKWNDPITPGKVTASIIRLDAEGKYDPSFKGPRFKGVGAIYTIAVQSDEKIVLGGVFTIEHTKGDGSVISYVNLIRLNKDGDIDETFNPTGGGTAGTPGNTNNEVRKILIKDAPGDGSRTILVGGFFNIYKGQDLRDTITTSDGVTRGTQGALIELSDNGALYKNWKVQNDLYNWARGGVYDMTFTKDGNYIIVGGEFGSVNGITVRRVARLRRDGSLDPAFYLNRFGPSYSIYSVAVQDDGKILMGGGPEFTFYATDKWGSDQKTRMRIARLNADGTLDEDFDPKVGFNGSRDTILTILVAKDAKILMGGQFASYQEKLCGNIVRLNEDASFDSTFITGLGFNNTIHDLVFQEKNANPEYHILAAGRFYKYDDYFLDPLEQGYVMRLVGAEVLPRSIMDFKAMNQRGASVYLQWKGLAVEGVYYLERSVDGVQFETIASFNAVHANKIYSHEDEVIQSGLIYYRVYYRKKTGETSFSNVVTVIKNAEFSAKIWKSGSHLYLRLNSSEIANQHLNLYLLNYAGQQIMYKPIKMTGTSLNLTIPLPYLNQNNLVILKTQEGNVIHKSLIQ